MMLHTFESDRWPGEAMFAVTPGGFIVSPFPHCWNSGYGWSSCPDDFQTLVEHPEEILGHVLTPEVFGTARGGT